MYDINQLQNLPMQHPITFRSNHLIQHIANERKWTMSSDNKMPIDAAIFLQTKEIEPASLKDGNQPLVTLPDLDRDPNLDAVNRAYRLHARDNRVIMVDVEPHATDALKNGSLNMPAHYTELSKNGGVHLLILVPEDLINDDNRYMFDELSVLKQAVDPDNPKEPAYEVLFNDHYITFTKRMLVDKPCINYNQDLNAKAQLKAFLDNLVRMDRDRREKRIAAKKELTDILDDMFDHAIDQRIKKFISAKPFDVARDKVSEKTPEDYGNDMSSYESGVASALAGHVINIQEKMLKTLSYKELAESLKEEHLIRAVYFLLKDTIPHRDKHDEFRDDIPWLMYVARNSMAYIRSRQKTNNTNKKG